MFITDGEFPKTVIRVTAIYYSVEPNYRFLNQLAQFVHTIEEAEAQLKAWLDELAIIDHCIEEIVLPVDEDQAKLRAAKALEKKLYRMRGEHYKEQETLQETINSLLAITHQGEYLPKEESE